MDKPQAAEWHILWDDPPLHLNSVRVGVGEEAPDGFVAAGPWEPFAVSNGRVYWRRPLKKAS